MKKRWFFESKFYVKDVIYEFLLVKKDIKIRYQNLVYRLNIKLKRLKYG
jgi:hypothetical protein